MKMTVYIFQALLFFACDAFAQSYSLNVEKFKATDNFIINLTNPIASKVVFNIKDKEGKSLWQESVLFAEKLKKVLFLGSLHPGEYVIEVSNGEETKAANILVAGTNKTVHPENGKTLIVGFKQKDGNSVDVIVQNKLNQEVFLKVFKDKTLLNNESLGNQDLIRKVIKLSDIEKGNYVLKVGTKENVYHYQFSI
jgi:hypothetical protein